MASLPLLTLLLTLLMAAPISLNPMSQANQLVRICQDSAVKDACRGVISYRFGGQSCHDQVLNIFCKVRDLRCFFPPGAQEPQLPMADPICRQSCKRIFDSCPISSLTLIAYVPMNDLLCNELPDQLCNDWGSQPGHRDNRSARVSDKPGSALESDICQARNASQCLVQLIADIARTPRRGAIGSFRMRYEHPFKRSDFKQGNFTYAAEVKLVRIGWLQALLSQPNNSPIGQPYIGGYDRRLNLVVKKVLYIGNGVVGYMLDPGSVQVVVVKSGCSCTPVKLNQSLILVGYNSYFDNLWKQVILLPNKRHYRCKIKRCWNKRSMRQFKRKQRQRLAQRLNPLSEPNDICECPCGRAERISCQKANRARRHRKPAGGRAGIARTFDYR